MLMGTTLKTGIPSFSRNKVHGEFSNITTCLILQGGSPASSTVCLHGSSFSMAGPFLRPASCCTLVISRSTISENGDKMIKVTKIA